MNISRGGLKAMTRFDTMHMHAPGCSGDAVKGTTENKLLMPQDPGLFIRTVTAVRFPKKLNKNRATYAAAFMVLF